MIDEPDLFGEDEGQGSLFGPEAAPPAYRPDPDKVRAQRRDEILDTLIAEKLLDDEVRKLRIDVTDPEIDRVVQGTMQEHKRTMDQLNGVLKVPDMKLSPETISALDKIWPGPGGEAPKAYSW